MSMKLGTLVLTLIATFGTGCCWFDQCGYYNQCGPCGPCGAYDPCTGLVAYPTGPFAKCRARKLMKKLQGDDCDCDKRGCRCHHHKDSCHHGGCSCNHGCCSDGGMYSSGCPTCETYGEPTYGEPIYGEPVYENGMETYYAPQSYPELMVPQEAQPMKPVPAPPAEPEPDRLPMPQDSSIPPVSYEVPAPLEGPSVPVLQPYDDH